MSGERHFTIGLIGNPNCGKSTIFNGLTGAHQHIGNWPGVTVEVQEGSFTLSDGTAADVVDSPGIYSLSATSEDERATLQYILSRQADLYVNVLDATQLERNLYLTMLLSELRVPIIVVVTMMDIARQRNTVVELPHLSEHLGVPVLGVNATRPAELKALTDLITRLKGTDVKPMEIPMGYPNEVEDEIDILDSATVKTAAGMRVPPRWVAIKALEGDPLITKALASYHDMASEIVGASIERIQTVLRESPDVILANARYGVIQGLCHDVIHAVPDATYLSEKIDKFVINRFLGIPIFLAIMAAVFWVTQALGGAFIDFFDKAGGALFVDTTRWLLEAAHAPGWLIALLAGGLGAGLQTVATFIPPIFFMFLCLAVLEDSGYMARAAFLMDRFMQWLGLPGKSFVPMLVGFGCSVPAMMATRTLENRRDRVLTIFLIPFMSCGAKLPVYVAFGAAFFAANPAKMVFSVYLFGIALAVVTGLALKATLFRGEPSQFIMELPPYHVPRPKHILMHTWERLRSFIFRAGSLIVPMMLVLGIVNSMGRDFSFKKHDPKNSLLASVGETLTPIFQPMGVEKDNWPATVALFTGLFAKEAVIGTMNSLYGQDAAAATVARPAERAPFPLFRGLGEAVLSVPQNLYALFTRETTPDEDASSSVFDTMRRHFSKGPHQAFAYLLFVLLYVPCIAATGVALRELGKFYGVVFITYLTTLGWCVATLYYQTTVGRDPLWIGVPVVILGAMFTAFWLIGRNRKVEML